MNTPLFGTAGLSDSYKAAGYKNAKAAAEYVSQIGLTAFEYQCGHGVRLAAETAQLLCESGKQHNVMFSLHAPYYISMSSLVEETRLNSLRYILQSAQAVRMLGGTRVIFHCGGAGKQNREQAMGKAKDTLQRAQALLDEQGYGDIVLCPETMGKVNQLGSLAEVLELCQLDKRLTPCIDFGHLNARSQGGLKTKADFAAVLDSIAQALPDERATSFHVHFSKIEYAAGGEKRHLTFEDTVFGPDYQPFIELVYQRGLRPVIISESAGTQTEDAATMLQYYNSLVK